KLRSGRRQRRKRRRSSGRRAPARKYLRRRGAFPTKDEMADYLEAYASRFELPVRPGTLVERVSRSGDRYFVRTPSGILEADQVVVAWPPISARARPSSQASFGRTSCNCTRASIAIRRS